MPNQTVILNAAGLVTSPNELSRDDGSLIEASNVLIRRDGIIEQRRGYNLYGSQLPEVNARVKQLTTYRNRILRHYANKLAFDSNAQGAFLDFAGSVLETEEGLRIKFVESNGNLYFTTADGVKKISARTPDDFSTVDGFVTSAGAVKAVDVDGEIIYTPNSQSAFLPQDGAVAYRIVWAYKDLNGNLVQGAPSQRAVVGNPMIELLIRDYMRLLDALDNLENTPLTAARINDKNYVQTLGLTLSSSASDLRTNLLALTTKLDNDIFLADQGAVAPLQIASASITAGTCTVTFSSGDPSLYLSPGSNIFLSGFAPTTGELNGAQEVTTVNSTTLTFNTSATDPVVLTSAEIHYNEFRSLTEPSIPSIPATHDELVEMQDYISDILLVMSLTPDTIISAADKVNTDELDVTTTATVELRITIPDGINSNYFYQVYRSSVAQATGVNSFEDIVPSDELQQVYEAFPTEAELEAGEIIIEDVTPDAFRGANLYTNASTGEGILQANEPPPFAKDINRYRNSVFYANTRTNHAMSLNLLGVQQMISDYDNGDIPKITISNGEVTNTYSFITGQQEITEITTVADVADSLNSKYFLIDSVENQFYVYFETTTAIDPAVPGRTGIKVNISTGDTADTVAERLRDKLSTYLDDFIATVNLNVVEVICYDVGETEDAADVDTGFTITNTQQGRGELVQPQITEIQAIPATDFTSIGAADYFTINTTLDRQRYYVWFNIGASTDPAVSGRDGLEVVLGGGETANQVAQLIADVLPLDEFETEVVGSLVTVTNIQYGTTTNATEFVVDPGFTVTTTQNGALDVLLSPLASPARAVDATARSFVRVINKNPGESIYGYYLSSAFDVPGKMLLQSRSLQNQDPFYILGNNSNTGTSFNPDISPEGFITSITAANPTVITTSIAHGMLTGDQVVLAATDSIPNADGLWTITMIDPTSFSIDLQVNIAGTEGSFIRATNALYSENEEKSNRVYFSKFQQPEAVPIINYFDVGAQDKAILRIFPMRDSLFVFKEDGLYRISGDSSPFQLELFDSSFITLAPDSVNIANNVIYAWTTQGIQSLTEGGSAVISRKIDNIILRLQSSNFVNFKTATWALGYESDNSYVVFTVNNMTDTVAQIAYRYSTLTESWTTFDLSHTCGVINPADDKMYLGASDVAYIEKEKKTFSRTDYSDREFTTVISGNALLNNTIILPSVTEFEVGDVVVQDQTITAFQFNTMLNKLDMDSGVADDDYDTLALNAGSNPRSAIILLATKLDADTGVSFNQFLTNVEDKNGTITNISEDNNTVITSANHGLLDGRIVLIDSSDSSPSINGTYVATVIDANTFSIPVKVTIGGSAGNWQTVGSNFEDIKICYNFIINTLNSDTGVAFNNYALINNNTIQEAIIDRINRITKTITLNLTLDYLVGDIVIHKAIESSFVYSPNTMGDPINHKHLREATLMFETRTLTRGTLSFRTDLLPEFQDIPFNLDGNGIFGHTPNFGDGFFGGFSNSAPFRTYVPRQCQRCRFIVVKFTHKVAREDYRINGTTLTGETGLSSRAFR
jgi:hypothetical protein